MQLLDCGALESSTYLCEGFCSMLYDFGLVQVCLASTSTCVVVAKHGMHVVMLLQGDLEALRAEINSLRASIKKGAEAA